MKNTMLWSALFTLMCTQVHADVTQPTTQPQTPNTTTAVTSDKTMPAPTAAPTIQPAAQPQQVQPAGQTAQPIQQLPAQATQAPASVAPVINCDYKIPAETKKIDQATIMTWSQKAIVQAFDFDPTSIDTQMQKLQACFTEQGWTGFNTALQKSGNVEAIKSQKLTVSSQIDGEVQVNEVKDNQWKIALPLQVVYQNDKEKVMQLLNVNLTVGRKINGDLGIMQMIASPRPAATAQPTTTPVPAEANTTTGTSTPTPAAPTTPSTPPVDTNTPTPPVNPTVPQTPAAGAPATTTN